MNILCIFSLVSALTVIPLYFHARNKINFNLELLRYLLRSLSYYIIYFDNILISHSDDNSRNSPSFNKKNYINLKDNRIFKTDPLSVTKPTDLFVSSNMESSSSTFNSVLNSKNKDHFLYSHGSSSNTMNFEEDPTLSNNIKSTFGMSQMDNNDPTKYETPNYYVSYNPSIGSPKMKMVSPVADISNPYITDKERLYKEYNYNINNDYNSFFH